MVFFRGFEDRTAAEQLTGAEIVIPESERWELPEGQYYADDLEGIDVYDSTTGRRLGTVKEATEGAAHDYLIIPHPDDPKREVMIPIVQSIVLSIDLEKRRADVKLPEGLLDI
jgi:16S rRNA processing protein RimM